MFYIFFSILYNYFRKRLIIGKNGVPLEIQVPVGVTIETDSGRVLGMNYFIYYNLFILTFYVTNTLHLTLLSTSYFINI